MTSSDQDFTSEEDQSSTSSEEDCHKCDGQYCTLDQLNYYKSIV